MWKVFKQLHVALSSNNFPSFCLKPKQVQCFEYLLQGFDVLSILPTGFESRYFFSYCQIFWQLSRAKILLL